MSEAEDKALAVAFSESAAAMIDAICDNQTLTKSLVSLVAESESLGAQWLASTCVTLLLAIKAGKIPHVIFELSR